MNLDFELEARGMSPVSSLLEKSEVLVVGAGGIGCELLKTLCLTGFRNITCIDLDTIDVSNLNRQFLFRKHHVGQSKSEVASKVVKSFVPNNSDLKVVSFHGNIKEDRFDVEFFKKFKLVLNALDNVNARQHVNRMCLAANIPLVDAGTTGYLGQTVVIKKGETKCYDCEPKKETTQQRFPICTIRSTPDKPVHCIVWAKELFKLLFGVAAESDLIDLPDPLQKETSKDESKSVVMKAVERFNHLPTNDELEKYCKKVFDAVFFEEIKLKLEMRDGYKTAVFKPKPLEYVKTRNNEETSSTTGDGPRRLWTLKECVENFEHSIKEIWTKRFDQIGSISFDKDDDLALTFVTAASNLRSQVFGIERKSLFDVKGIAGNIIHAIATTNAIVAGMQVLEAIRLLGNYEKEKMTKDCKFVWVSRVPIGAGMLLQPTSLEPPVPTCVACGQAEQQLYIDLKKSTLGDVVNKVLKARIGVNYPIVMLQSSVVYESGDDLDEDEVKNYEQNLLKTLENCPGGGLREGSQLSVEDFSQNLKFRLVLHHREIKLDEGGEISGELFELSGEPPKAKEDDPSSKRAKLEPEEEEEDDDDIIIEEDEDEDDVIIL